MQIIILHVAISFAVAIQYLKEQEAARIPLGSLEVCPLSSLPFHLAHAPEGREHVPGFTIRSADKPSK